MRACACRGTAGVAHVSCLAEQAKILVAEAEENNLADTKWVRWHTCGLCEQEHHGVVRCALAWACWKTYLGRPEAEQLYQFRSMAMQQLGNGLALAEHYEDALSVREAEVATKRRVGAPVDHILAALCNLAGTYHSLKQHDKSLAMFRAAYDNAIAELGPDHALSINSALNLSSILVDTKCSREAQSLLRKVAPLAR